MKKMIAPELQEVVNAELSWNYDTRSAWEDITGRLQIRDSIDRLINEGGAERLIAWFNQKEYEQEAWWDEYPNKQHRFEYITRELDTIDFKVIVARWLREKPTQVSDEERQRCYSDYYYEVNQVYPDDGPMTMKSDNGAYIYWRGTHLDHYTYPYDMLGEARELTKACRYVEEVLGLPVNGYTSWGEFSLFAVMGKDHPYKRLHYDLHCRGLWEKPETREVVFAQMHHIVAYALYYDGKKWHWVKDRRNDLEPWKPFTEKNNGMLNGAFEYHTIQALGGWGYPELEPDGYGQSPTRSLEVWMDWYKKHGITPDFLNTSNKEIWCEYTDQPEKCPYCTGSIRH